MLNDEDVSMQIPAAGEAIGMGRPAVCNVTEGARRPVPHQRDFPD